MTDGTIRSLDLRKIKIDDDDFRLMCYDPALNNTASCISRITFIDGDKGILRYRGYSIEDLAEKSTYLETAYLILHGELPTTRSCPVGSITSRTTHSSTRASKNFSMAFTTMRTPWAC